MQEAGGDTHYVVVGGGIAGTSCVDELIRIDPRARVTIVSPTEELKTIKVVKRVSEHVEELAVVENPLRSLGASACAQGRLRHVKQTATALDPERKVITLANGGTLAFDKLCVCTGAVPKLVGPADLVMTVRDTDSAARLAEALRGARKVIVAGNGAIALEVVNKLRGLQVVWLVKHKHIGDALLDVDVARFLLRGFEAQHRGEVEVRELKAEPSQTSPKTAHQTKEPPRAEPEPALREGVSAVGHAIGPQWFHSIGSGPGNGQEAARTDIQVNYSCEIAEVFRGQGEWPVCARLVTGGVVGADVIVSCIGAEANLEGICVRSNGDGGVAAPPLRRSSRDGGLLVDVHMRTSAADVFAAGDCCTLDSSAGLAGEHFFQMKLWSQAKLMGGYAAHCMVGSAEADLMTLGFEMFSHATRFFGRKVVLLGLYDGQGLEGEPHKDKICYTREDQDEGVFVRVLLVRGRLRGAVLVGDTGLEDVMENLILNGIDLTDFGPDLLDPDNDLEDYFD